jgi:membrane protease YdiL (CAAX protease family)
MLFIKVIVFYYLAMDIGEQLFRYISYLSLNWLSALQPNWQPVIQNILELDYGRFVGRIGAFIGTILVFSIYSWLVDGIKLKNSLLWSVKEKFSYFIKGSALGSTMVLIMIALVLVTGAIHLSPQTYWSSYLLPVILLYIISMLLTAASEELIFRGYILDNLLKKLNPHLAVMLTALPFGLLHLYFTGSFLYAIQATLFGIVAGYAYVWSRNLYFCIGMHFAWNCIESIVFSQDLFMLKVNNVLLAGAKNITPDREGLLSLPGLMIGFAVLYTCRRMLQPNR